MKVRVYDKETNMYFLSEVYAIVDSGWYGRYLVLISDGEKDCLKFFDYMDKESPAPYHKVFINTVTNKTENWVYKSGAFLLNVKKALGLKKIRFESFSGLPEILNNNVLMAELLCGKSIFFEKFNMLRLNSQLNSWNYINDEADIEKLMQATGGFHDAILVSLNYVSGSEEVEGGYIVQDCEKRVNMHFSSCWCDDIELVFEGVSALNLRPAQENYSSNIYSATLNLLEDKTIFFCNTETESETEAADYTWIKAFSLRWQFKAKKV